MQRLRDLGLEEGDILPEEFVSGLRDHGIRPVEWEDPGIGYVVPKEVLAVLQQ
uniref:hypothetical protein n=1 Tax=Streptomyces scabiei TaxID=1930 RepID=UPI0013C51337|nr:hypothetical protein [Streptomyces scabiei]